MNPADPSVLDVRTIAHRLGVEPVRGLSEEEARQRLAADGPNELRTAPPMPTWRKILAQFQDPLIYLLLVAVVISLVIMVGLKALHDLVRPKREPLIQRYIEIAGRITALFVGTISVEMIMQGLRSWVQKF